MNVVIVSALKEAVVKKFGEATWNGAIERAGLSREMRFLTPEVPDENVLKVIRALCDETKMEPQQLFDPFAEHWIFDFSQRYYKMFYVGCKSAKDFLLKMDYVHVLATKHISGARPPRFEYEWKDPKTLIMKYRSHRSMIDLMISLIKAVGKFYNEKLEVEKLDSQRVKITFR